MIFFHVLHHDYGMIHMIQNRLHHTRDVLPGEICGPSGMALPCRSSQRRGPASAGRSSRTVAPATMQTDAMVQCSQDCLVTIPPYPPSFARLDRELILSKRRLCSTNSAQRRGTRFRSQRTYCHIVWCNRSCTVDGYCHGRSPQWPHSACPAIAAHVPWSLLRELSGVWRASANLYFISF